MILKMIHFDFENDEWFNLCFIYIYIRANLFPAESIEIKIFHIWKLRDSVQCVIINFSFFFFFIRIIMIVRKCYYNNGNSQDYKIIKKREYLLIEIRRNETIYKLNLELCQFSFDIFNILLRYWLIFKILQIWKKKFNKQLITINKILNNNWKHKKFESIYQFHFFASDIFHCVH